MSAETPPQDRDAAAPAPAAAAPTRPERISLLVLFLCAAQIAAPLIYLHHCSGA